MACNYGATKAAVDQLTRAFARELGPHGINVNSIAPGSIETDQLFVKRRGEEAQRHAARRAKVAVLGRRGKPDDIANLTLFLATDTSSFIPGQTIHADGGRTEHVVTPPERRVEIGAGGTNKSQAVTARRRQPFRGAPLA